MQPHWQAYIWVSRGGALGCRGGAFFRHTKTSVHHDIITSIPKDKKKEYCMLFDVAVVYHDLAHTFKLS